MLRRWVVVAICVAVSSCMTAACETDADVEALRPEAAKVTDFLAQNEWAEVRSDFDDSLEQRLGADGLQQAWDQVVQAMGAYEARGEPTEVDKPGDFVVFDTPMGFEKGTMKSRVTFRPDGEIAGLFILIPEAP